MLCSFFLIYFLIGIVVANSTPPLENQLEPLLARIINLRYCDSIEHRFEYYPYAEVERIICGFDSGQVIEYSLYCSQLSSAWVRHANIQVGQILDWYGRPDIMKITRRGRLYMVWGDYRVGEVTLTAYAYAPEMYSQVYDIMRSYPPKGC